MKPITLLLSMTSRAAVLSFARSARAEEKHGARVYPGARYAHVPE